MFQKTVWLATLLGVVLVMHGSAIADEGDEDAPPPAAEEQGDDGAPPGGVVVPEGEDDDIGFIEGAQGERLEVNVLGSMPIIGDDPREDLRKIPGSGTSLKLKDLNTQKQTTSLQEAVRGLPGVNVRDEVLSGVVPNIGIRGLNPDRSEKILILEDGVPAGLAPYSVNAAYYIPPIERMAQVELLKGSGQILYGPHTVGGVLNMITPEIPLVPSGTLDLMGGTHGYAFAHVMYGGTHGRFGYWVSALTKQGHGYKTNSEFDIHDITMKFRYEFSRCTNATLKLSYYDSEVETTYLGLTKPMYDDDPLQNPARDDLLEVSWLSGQLTVQHLFSPRLELLVNLYGHTASRDWNRQDFARNTNFDPPPANTARTVGDTGVDGGAIYMLESFGSRDRDFDVVGLEPRLIGQHCLFRREAEFHLGARIHYEHFVDERNNRDTYAGPVYTRNREDDHIYALAVFGQERVQVTRRLGLSAGLRLEAYRQMRHITRGNNMPVDIEGDSLNLEWIPGAGFTYDLGPNTVYGGVHRGFAPPRLSESIDSNGEDAALDAELSWNYELGVRGEPRPWLYYDVTGFLLDFENQIVPDNESGGASTENTNAGESIHYGFELSMQADLIHAFSRACDKPRCQPSLWLDVAYTYVMTENTTSGGLFEGNELPYAPNHILRAGMTFEDPRSNLTAGFVGTWTSEQYADQANTVVESNDGLVGEVPAYWVLDASVEWRVPRSRFTLRAAMNNILDERYVASRAPAGIHVGAPRHAFLGVRIDL